MTRGIIWVVWTSGERDVASEHKERWDASLDAQDAWDAEYRVLASGRNTRGSHTRSVFADEQGHARKERSKNLLTTLPPIECLLSPIYLQPSDGSYFTLNSV